MRHTFQKSTHIPHPETIVTGEKNNDHVLTLTWIIDRNVNETEHITEIKSFANKHNLTVNEWIPYHLKVTGKVKDIKEAFGLTILNFQTTKGKEYFSSINDFSLPIHFKGKTELILGFNNYPINKRKTNRISRGITGPTGPQNPYFPQQVAGFYKFPTPNQPGLGQKVGIIEQGGGYGYTGPQYVNNQANLRDYFNAIGVTGPAPSTLRWVSVDNAINDPTDTDSNIEVAIDIDIIAAIAPYTQIVVYFAPNTDQGFYDAFAQAYNDGCNAISNSWGNYEDVFPSSFKTTLSTLFQTMVNRTSIASASGDKGSNDDGPTGTLNVDFPASSPYNLGCGATTLITDNTNILNEYV